MSQQQLAEHDDGEVTAFRKIGPRTTSLEALREKEGLSGRTLVVDHQPQMSDGDIDLSEEDEVE